jgi:hypothetical protein
MGLVICWAVLGVARTKKVAKRTNEVKRLRADTFMGVSLELFASKNGEEGVHFSLAQLRKDSPGGD